MGTQFSLAILATRTFKFDYLPGGKERDCLQSLYVGFYNLHTFDLNTKQILEFEFLQGRAGCGWGRRSLAQVRALSD